MRLSQQPHFFKVVEAFPTEKFQLIVATAKSDHYNKAKTAVFDNYCSVLRPQIPVHQQLV
jgi:hypothetical protein